MSKINSNNDHNSNRERKLNVIMLGAARNVQGGVSAVVNQYYDAKLDQKINLKYIATMRDGNKVKKLMTAVNAIIKYLFLISQYEVIHVHMSSRASFFRKSFFIKAAYQQGKKIVIHMHGSEFDVFYDKECNEKQKKQVRDIFSMANIVIALSEEWKEYLSTICETKKIIVLYNAVSVPDFTRTNYRDKKVLFLGRLGKRKGTYDLIDVIPEILKKVPSARFYFGGDGEVSYCTEICIEKGIQNSVEFLGWITGRNRIKYLESCNIFVLPSYHEGMPMSLLEAMSYGDVVISTKVGGIPKVIKNNVNGLLIQAGNIEELKNSLLEVLSGEGKKELGMAAYKTILKQFNIENNITALTELYKTLVCQN